MALSAGERLGPYEILAPLGAGGMGEVYKAQDTRLDRTVAIKVLPSHVAGNPEVRQRFEREARAVSSLNHSHICTLYDIGSENGVDFMVMEHIEGDTLADRLSKGALPFDQALRRGIEIADALDKAHRQGVVHRDLKPGNIMLTKSGAKLLDFGLAKMTAAETNAGGVSALPTEAKPLTQEGSILGTFQYMAPEQLEGKEADARADLFAFGAVLYEMLTGRKVFEGESQASLITAIMSAEPASVSDLQPLTPFALERLVKRCLAKDPEDRWQSARDVTLELGWIRDKGDADASTTAPAGARSRKRLSWALVLLLAAAIVGVVVHRFTEPDAPPVIRFRTEAGELSVTNGQFVKITPDGRTLVYRGERDGVSQLYRRALDEIEGTPLPGTENPNNLFISPDGRWAGFLQVADLLLRKVSLSGGAPVTISELPVAARGVSWGDDDTIVFGSDGGGLWQIPARGGEPQPLTNPAEGHEHNRPFHLPGAKGVLFTVWAGGTSEVAVLPPGSNEPRVLLEGTTPQLTASGHLVYQREGGLWAVAFDSDRLAIKGTPAPVVEGVQLTGNTAAQFALSHEGTLVYVPPDVGAAFRLVGVDREGSVTPLSKNLEALDQPRLSPDESRVAVEMNSPLTGFDLWLHDIERGTRSRLTVDGGTNAVWSPGGDRIAFRHYAGNLLTISADGSGESEVLYRRDDGDLLHPVPSSWSPDGRFLALATLGGDIFVLALGGEPEPFLATEFTERNPMFSPDGRFLAYVSDETGRNEVYVRQFPGPGGKWTLSIDGGTLPVWSKDGSELFYREGNRIMEVSIQKEPTFSADAPRVVLDIGFAAEPPTFDVSRDGERFLMIQRDASSKRSLVVVLNWFEELKRLVPK